MNHSGVNMFFWSMKSASYCTPRTKLHGQGFEPPPRRGRGAAASSPARAAGAAAWASHPWGSGSGQRKRHVAVVRVGWNGETLGVSWGFNQSSWGLILWNQVFLLNDSCFFPMATTIFLLGLLLRQRTIFWWVCWCDVLNYTPWKSA